MAEVAEVLCSERGVLEPLQTGVSLWAQVEELKSQLQECSNPPLTVIGFSWGAWLSLILAAQYPHLVDRVILIGSGPFEEKYVRKIMETRFSRLSEAERDETIGILAALDNPDDAVDEEKDRALSFGLARIGELFRRTDAFDPVECESIVECNSDIYQAVWRDASIMRQTGELLELCKKVRCPVIAIHGGFDPHPSEGVREPLQTVLNSFQFILLENCGHKPWIEKRAKGKFYSTLRELLE